MDCAVAELNGLGLKSNNGFRKGVMAKFWSSGTGGGASLCQFSSTPRAARPARYFVHARFPRQFSSANNKAINVTKTTIAITIRRSRRPPFPVGVSILAFQYPLNLLCNFKTHG